VAHLVIIITPLSAMERNHARRWTIGCTCFFTFFF